MSDQSYFSLSVVASDTLTTLLPPDIAAQIPELQLHSSARSPIPSRAVSGISRSYWFPEAVETLLTAANAPAILNFLCDLTFQYEHRQSYGDDDSWVDLHRYSCFQGYDTLFPIVSALDGVWDWCQANPDAAALAMESSQRQEAIAEIQEAIAAAKITFDPNQESSWGEEGESYTFLFDVLYTYRSLLRYALDNNSWVLYEAVRGEFSGWRGQN